MNKLLFFGGFIIVGLIALILLILNIAKNGIINARFALYCSIGFFLSQLFHSLIFYGHKSDTIVGFPHYNLPISYAIKFSFILFFLSLIILILASHKIYSLPVSFLILITMPLLLSQVFGRSLIKLGFEAAFCFIVFLSLLLEKYYSSSIIKGLTLDNIKFFYNELWEILKLSIPICIFWIGTVGVAFVVQFLRDQYFKDNPSMAQLQMFRYGIMFIYSALGIGILFYYPLCTKISHLRSLLFKG